MHAWLWPPSVSHPDDLAREGRQEHHADGGGYILIDTSPTGRTADPSLSHSQCLLCESCYRRFDVHPI
jgi:hypothetical protein